MACTIAIAGKGGTGKTTLAGLLIDYLAREGMTPVLAVDADANSNLNEVLGSKIDKTLGELRETAKNAESDPDTPIQPGLTKQEYLSHSFIDALTEEDDFDLLVMGRTEGEGCYCFINDLLKAEIQRYSKNYKYVVVDNEAGMEHISRGVLPDIDMILVVSDPTRRGVQAAARIQELAFELKKKVAAVKLIVNRAPGGELSEGVSEEIARHALELAGVVPSDENIFLFDSEGRPMVQLPEDSPARKAFFEILRRIL